MYNPLSEEQKKVVKSVLFGNQKQASVINEGVVAIVGRGIAEATTGEAAISSSENFVQAVQDFLQTSIDNGRPVNATILMLVGGERSLLALQAEGPKCVFCESAGPDTPKYNFGIYMLGEAPAAPVADLSGSMAAPPAEAPRFTAETQKKFEDLSYTAQRDYLVKAITPLVPEAVKAELSSPVEQALVGSQWYFKNN